MPPVLAEEFSRALGFAREARRALDAGDWTRAMAASRKAIEALGAQMPDQGDENAIAALFERSAHPKAAKAYAGVVSRVKGLSSFALHDLQSDLHYSRGEVLFILRSTESIIALVASLLSRDR